MDNFTHSLVAWAIGQTGLKRKSRKGLAALILGANMPDIDVFFGHSCWVPLATHRGFTHSFAGGMIVMPLLLAGLLWLLDRWQASRGRAFKSGLPMRFGWLVALSYIGAISHPLLDWQTSYAVQLLSPFSSRWYHAESLFIVDVWLWTGLALAIWLSRRRERAGGEWRRPTRAVLAGVVAYIGLNQGLTAHAKHELEVERPYPKVDSVFAKMEPVKFWTRGLTYRTGRGIGYAYWSPGGGLVHVEAPVPDNMDDPLARRAMFATYELTHFMRWSVMPMAEIRRGKCNATVIFTDARFRDANVPWRKDGNPFLHEVVVPIKGKGCP